MGLTGHIFAVIAMLAVSVSATEKEMTISIEAGARDCFFESVRTGEVIDIEYQVIDGGHGDLDVNFELIEPTGRVIFADFKKSDNIHRVEAQLTGDYRVCFDNSFSAFNRKTVFFELIVEKEDAGASENPFDELFEGLTPDEFYDMKVQDIQDAIGRVRQHITKARQFQDLIRSYEARDRNIAEENYFKVNAWSMFQILTMLTVGSLQVIMVRSLFDTKSKVHKFWSKLS